MIAVVAVLVVVIMNQFDFVFPCPFCPCVFSSRSDLDLHLKAFGNFLHLRLWRCVHVLLEVDGSVAGVDNHGGWFHKSKRIYASTVRACRKLLIECKYVSGIYESV